MKRKLLTGKYDQQVALTLPKNVTGEYFTRGNCDVVMSDTINTSKNRLDAHWKHGDFLFHYRATYSLPEPEIRD